MKERKRAGWVGGFLPRICMIALNITEFIYILFSKQAKTDRERGVPPEYGSSTCRMALYITGILTFSDGVSERKRERVPVIYFFKEEVLY